MAAGRVTITRPAMIGLRIIIAAPQRFSRPTKRWFPERSANRRPVSALRRLINAKTAKGLAELAPEAQYVHGS